MIPLSKIIKLIQNDSFYNKFKKKIKSFNLLKKDKVILAVSGGLDSIALLYLMKALNKYQILVVHINHKLRKDSDKDECFVKKISQEMNVEFISKSLNKETKLKGVSIEDWGRQNRYSFLKRIMIKTGSKIVMTAHHANDQVETILMNFSRGSGILGLRGIGKEDNFLIRPFLSYKKADIIHFSQRIGFKFRNDFTNNDLSIRRNFIRHKVIKPWENEMQFIVKGFEKSVSFIKEWQLALDHLIINFIISEIDISSNRFSIKKKNIINYPKLIKIRIIQLLIDRDKKVLWSKHRIEMLDNFFKKNVVGKILNINENWRILNDRDFIIAEKKNKNSVPKILKIQKNSKIVFNDFKLEFILSKKMKRFNQNKYEIVDWAKIKNKTLKIRNWVKGDTFQPLGMTGNQKISDFLINHKINQFLKEKIPIMTADEKIIWICGMRISDKIKITNETREYVFFKCNKT